ncbi:M16 family metallopeptidase [Nocardioides sp. NPDC059952]|uniref:M16 family metallopeptidase n=1 Tax=Nocardioides sp. NPDC059952 TaxID=3347014 RepID=UPI003657B94A
MTAIVADLDTWLAPLEGLVSGAVVDGVPVLLASRPGPVTGGIYFRVGYADETLPVGGITHLVEHLALHHHDLADRHTNGHTTEQWTGFHTTGTAGEVVAFLNEVCASMRDLPLGRIDTEKEILRAEAARNGRGGIGAAMRVWRYGARGPGLSGQDEEGLFRLGTDEVTGWVNTWFTSGNAVAFLTVDEVPAELSLGLPPGERRPVRLPPETLPSKPAWFRSGFDGIVLDAMVPRTPAANVFSAVVTRVLMRELRRDQGLSYDAGCGYDRIEADTARLTIHADALEAKAGVVTSVVAEILAGMRAGRVDRADIDAIREQAARELDLPDLGAAILPGTCIDLLLGADVMDPRDRAAMDAVTVEDVAEVARAVWADALVAISSGHGFGGATRAPHQSNSAVEGTTYTSLVKEGNELVIGPDGVTRRTPDSLVTVRFDDLAAIGAVADGARQLTGNDALSIAVEPTLWKGLDAEIVARDIDSRVPSEMVVPYPPREVDRIPEPPKNPAPLEPADSSPPAWDGFGPWAVWTAFALYVLAALASLPALIGLWSLMHDDLPREDQTIQIVWIGATALLWLFAGGLTFGVRRRIRLNEQG